MSDYFTEQEFEEYMDKWDKIKPFNEKEWKEFQYLIKGDIRYSPNYQAYIKYQKKVDEKRWAILKKRLSVPFKNS